MRIAKAVNQYYGLYFEQAIASIINEVEVSNTTGFSFPKGHEAEIEADARSVVDKYFSDAKVAKHIGRETSSKSGDIIIDGVSYEIKYVSGGAGTHFNTSVSYTKNLGYISMVDFMKSVGLFKLAAESFGSKYSSRTTCHRVPDASSRTSCTSTGAPSRWIRPTMPHIS